MWCMNLAKINLILQLWAVDSCWQSDWQSGCMVLPWTGPAWALQGLAAHGKDWL